MNKQRRKDIEDVKDRIFECKVQLEAIRDEEQEYFDNMPESFQQGDKGSAVEGNISCLDDAISQLEQACENMDSAMEGQ